MNNLRYENITYKLEGSIKMPQSMTDLVKKETAILNIKDQPFFTGAETRKATKTKGI